MKGSEFYCTNGTRPPEIRVWNVMCKHSDVIYYNHYSRGFPFYNDKLIGRRGLDLLTACGVLQFARTKFR